MMTHKLVAVINKTLPSGVALNALAHMTLGLGNSVETSSLQFSTYTDLTGNQYPNISNMPFIILRATSAEIRKLVTVAREKSFAHGIFLNTMTNGGWVEQVTRTAETPEDQLIYFGCVIFGPWDDVSAATKKLSLWRDQAPQETNG